MLKENRMQKVSTQFILPSKRRVTLVEYLGRTSVSNLVWFGILLYIFFVTFFSGIEYLLQNPYSFKDEPTLDFWDLMYFNFVTILTVGYGDYSPKGYFRILAVIEAFIGVGVYSFFVAILTIKSLF